MRHPQVALMPSRFKTVMMTFLRRVGFQRPRAPPPHRSRIGSEHLLTMLVEYIRSGGHRGETRVATRTFVFILWSDQLSETLTYEPSCVQVQNAASMAFHTKGSCGSIRRGPRESSSRNASSPFLNDQERLQASQVTHPSLSTDAALIFIFYLSLTHSENDVRTQGNSVH